MYLDLGNRISKEMSQREPVSHCQDERMEGRCTRTSTSGQKLCLCPEQLKCPPFFRIIT